MGTAVAIPGMLTASLMLLIGTWFVALGRVSVAMRAETSTQAVRIEIGSRILAADAA